VRFLSVEPLLEDLGQVDLTGIHWVIVGGESGPGARPMKPDWVRSLRDQCERSSVPFFFKQWGGFNKKKAGRILDGRTHDDMPAIPVRPVPSKKERDAIPTALGIGQPRRWALEVTHVEMNDLGALDKGEEDHR
jgi:hypothetical protein